MQEIEYCPDIMLLKDNPMYNYDEVIISAIKQKLAEFNIIEKKSSMGHAAFQWSCSSDCIWIACQIYIAEMS